MRLSIQDNHRGFTALLVNAFAGEVCSSVDRAAPETRLDDGSGGAPISQLAAICSALARASAKADQLLGDGPAAHAQVLEWLTWCDAELGAVSDAKLAALNTHLATRTFLAGTPVLSAADLCAFGCVHPAVESLPPAQHDQFCNLLRWFDLLQHTADAGRIFSRVAIPLPAWVPPPPPPKAERAKSEAPSAAAGGQQGGGKKDKTAAAGKAAAAGSAAGAAASAATAAGKAAAPGSKAAAAAAGAPAGSSGSSSTAAPAAAGEQEGKKAKEKKEKAAKPAKEADEARIDMIDIRVGTIVSVQQHPNADALYVEEIDVGEPCPRQVISGLVKYVPREAMQGRRVLVCCNLKPAKMRDVMSYGMVLCASNDTHDRVDPITPPEGVPDGERITFEGFSNEPLEEVNPKRKILERLFPDLTTSADGTPTYKGVPFMTSKGPVASSIPNAHVA